MNSFKRLIGHLVSCKGASHLISQMRDRELTAVEDSISLFIGDTVSVLLKQADASWEQYRKLECDAIRAAFAQGTMAPVVQMECWIDLTDDHRKFLVEQYDYMRNGRPAPGKRTR